jgi:RimJ/RimL family protein N-acetyltransferase
VTRRELPDTVELSDGLVTLRRWSTSDIPALTAIWQDAELLRRFGVVPPITDESSARFVGGNELQWRAGTELALAVAVGGAVVGGCELDRADSDEPDLGYWLGPEARGNGYATRAAELMLDWARGVLGVTRFTAEIEPDNPSSIAVAERLGFAVIPGVERTDDDRRLAAYSLSR